MSDKKLTLNEIVETIGQAVYEHTDDNLEINKQVGNFLNIAVSGYVLVEWPESQDFMEEEWFEEEAILALDLKDKIGSSAYFLPIKRIV